MPPISINIVTDLGEREFEVRFDRDEGVGLLTAKNGKSYLILDSIDYWFDVVQDSYPKKKACACRNQWFFVKFDYEPREGTDDFRSVRIEGRCNACDKEKEIGTIDIDYSPTQELFDFPITYCPDPKLKCSVRQVNGYWGLDDRASLLTFMNSDLGLDTYCWYWATDTGERLFEKVDESNRSRLLSPDCKYLAFYFSERPVSIETIRVDGGIYVPGDPWRKDELIKLTSPLTIMLKEGPGSLYYVYFSTQYIDAGAVHDKSKPFVELCDRVLDWLRGHFIHSRGKDCFDSRFEYDRLRLNQFSRGQ
jgi:hypothetical protein